MDPGLIGVVASACWLSYRYHDLHDDHPSRQHALAIALVGVSFLATIVAVPVVALALVGNLLGPNAAALYVDACTLALALLVLSEAASLTCRAAPQPRYRYSSASV